MSYVDTQKSHGIDPNLDRGRKVKDLYQGNVATIKANMPWLFRRYTEYHQWNESKILSLSAYQGAMANEVWRGHADFPFTTPYCNSRIGILMGSGEFIVNFPLPRAHGQYKGDGPQQHWYGGNNNNWAATVIRMCPKAEWLGSDLHEMNCMQSTSWGLEGNESYTEGGSVDGVCFLGNNASWYDPSYTESGLACWDDGESTENGRVRANNFNGYGIKIVRSTPGTFRNISAFTNALAGIGLIGTELNTINLGTITGDDNPALIVQKAGYGRGAGGIVTLNLGKSESGKRTPNKGQILIWQQSPCVGILNINAAQCDMNFADVHSPIVLNSYPGSDGQAQVVTGCVKFWNAKALIHDIGYKRDYPWGVYRPVHFSYTSCEGGVLTDVSTRKAIPSRAVNASARLGTVPTGSDFNYANGTPVYTMGTPPSQPTPVACTGWTAGAWSAWSACVNGQQTRTRTVTATPAGCTGTPPNKPTEVETQACLAPAWTTIWPGGNVLVGTSLPINPPVTATKVKITDLIVSPTYNLANYGRVLGTGAGKPSLQLHQNGYFIFNNVRCASTNAATVTKGVKWGGEVTIPSSAISCAWQTDPGQHGALVCSCAKMEVQ